MCLSQYYFQRPLFQACKIQTNYLKGWWTRHICPKDAFGRPFTINKSREQCLKALHSSKLSKSDDWKKTMFGFKHKKLKNTLLTLENTFVRTEFDYKANFKTFRFFFTLKVCFLSKTLPKVLSVWLISRLHDVLVVICSSVKVFLQRTPKTRRSWKRVI